MADLAADRIEDGAQTDFARELTLFDAIVIGASRAGLVPRAFFGDIPERVGERFEGQVVMAKQHRALETFVGRWVRRWLVQRPGETVASPDEM